MIVTGPGGTATCISFEAVRVIGTGAPLTVACQRGNQLRRTSAVPPGLVPLAVSRPLPDSTARLVAPMVTMQFGALFRHAP